MRVRVLTSMDRTGGEACHLASLRCCAAGAIFGCRVCHGRRIDPDHHRVGDLVRESLALVVPQRPQESDTELHTVADLARHGAAEPDRLTGLDRDQLRARHPAAEALPRGALQIARVPDPETQQPQVTDCAEYQGPGRAAERY